jgi:hypothetical protein
MNGPLVPGGLMTPQAGLWFALAAGVLFGFFLARAGFGSPKKLTAMFYFKDFAVLRVMFTAVVAAMIGLLGLASMRSVLRAWLSPRLTSGLRRSRGC